MMEQGRRLAVLSAAGYLRYVAFSRREDGKT